MTNRPRFSLLLLVTLTAASGASCPQFLQPYSAPLPRVLPAEPTLSDVIAAVNNNTAKVQSLSTREASLSVPLLPSLRAELHVDRPRRLRLLADTRLTGPEIDVGSNDELFWFWIKRAPQAAIYYCRHEQFATSAARQVLPIEPEWLIESLGLVTLDANVPHRGPEPAGGGRLRIESPLATASGPMTRVTLVDAGGGFVVEQHVYDAQGKLVASALASRHSRHPQTGAVLPARIDIQTPATAYAAAFSMRLDLQNLVVNQLPPEAQTLWTPPNYAGFTPVDLADPNLRLVEPTTAVPSRWIQRR